MFWFVIWVVLCIAVAVFANNRGRSGGAWFVLSLIISPLLGLLFVAVSKDLKKDQQTAVSTPGPTSHVKCPHCAEWVLPEASVCKHCGGALVPNHEFHANAAKAAQAAKTEDGNNLAIGVAAIFGLFVLGGLISTCSG